MLLIHFPCRRHQEFKSHMTCDYPKGIMMEVHGACLIKFSLVPSTVSADAGGAWDGWRSKSR